MDRRAFMTRSAASLAGLSLGRGAFATGRPAQSPSATAPEERMNVAFVISPGANVIDLAGAWEVFQDVMIGEGADHRMPFHTYTVSDHREPLEATGGLTLVPDHTLDDAPPPRIVSVGAQRGSSTIHEWIAHQAKRADVVMSVCTGAFQLARAGVLDGRRATTHHQFWDAFEREFPKVELVRGRRFVEDGKLVTAGGLTSGIDAALHVVARTLDTAAAERTAAYMEYESDGWRTGERAKVDSSR